MGQLHTEPRTERGRNLRGEIQELLSTHARGLTDGDGETIARTFETPAFVLTKSGAMALASHADVVTLFSGSKAKLHDRGAAATRGDIVGIEKIGDHLVIVEARWPYIDEDGREIGSERSSYTLLRDGKGKLRVRSVLMRGEDKRAS